MKTVRLLCLLFLAHASLRAQEFKASVSYRYLAAKQWDKAIQTYNFSRPYLENAQPLLIHGGQVSGAYIFKSSKKCHHGIDLSYVYCTSAAENENLNNRLNLHFLSLGYILHLESTQKAKGLYTDIILSAVSSGLFRKVNGEAFTYDENTARALGIGGELSVRAGYYVHLKNASYCSPFLSAGYTPYFYSPNSEMVINQTKGLVGANWTGIFALQVGLSYHLRQPDKH